jgi:hypothetical protein
MTRYHPPERYRPETPGPEAYTPAPPPVSRTISREEKKHPYPELLKRDEQMFKAAELIVLSELHRPALERIHFLVRTALTETRAVIIENCRDPGLLRELLKENSERGNMKTFLEERLRELCVD